MDELNLRYAVADDLDFVSRVVTEVSEGIVECLFADLLPMQQASDVLRLAFGRNVAPYVTENVILAEVGDQTAGLLFSYDAREQQIPTLMENFLTAKRIDPVREVLTATVDDALWVNTLWVNPQFRGRGLAQLLLEVAADKARDLSLKKIALHAFAENEAALGLYRKAGFEVLKEVMLGDPLSARHPKGGRVLSKTLDTPA